MTKATKIFALLGRTVDYSYSPLIHNTAFRALDLPFHYTVFNIAEPDQVQDALRGARALGIAGFNVTIPYKKTVVPFLDELSEEAASIQAVNTIVNEKGKLTGHNTDIAGFAAPLLPYRESIADNTVSIFGGGGASLAAIEAFNRFFAPKEILLFVRDTEKACALLDHTGYNNSAPLTILRLTEPEPIRECRVIVNATPVGTRGRDGERSIIPLDRELLNADQIVYDMVYNPFDTPLLHAAEQAGATTISGIEMLIGQAERAFTLWTNMQMPIAEVRAALLQEIQQQQI
ncbi:MAG: shikimate dehydrogenase [Chlorobium sp.]|nr:MAG: shikimate dehydrogenase [Chlorobium sp.]